LRKLTKKTWMIIIKLKIHSSTETRIYLYFHRTKKMQFLILIQMPIHKSIQLVFMLRGEDLFLIRFKRLDIIITSLIFRLLNLKMMWVPKSAKRLRKNRISKKIKWKKLKNSKRIWKIKLCRKKLLILRFWKINLITSFYLNLNKFFRIKFKY
jgi:hypothetical protein